MKLSIAQWAGAKGLGLSFMDYSITLHFHLLADFRIRETFTMKKAKDYIFKVYKNRRHTIAIWDRDVVFLGFMLQIQKRKY